MTAGGASARGFSLLEVVLALAITIVVMSLVAATLGQVRVIVAAQSELATTGDGATRALSELSRDIAHAGQGLGTPFPSVLPWTPGDAGPSSSRLTVRSNPALSSTRITKNPIVALEDLEVVPGHRFREGETVVLTDARLRSELAEVRSASRAAIALRSLETDDGRLRGRYDAESAARVLGVREIRYYTRPSRGADGLELVKEVPGESLRVLARELEALEFTYLDREGESLTLGRVAGHEELGTIRISMRYRASDARRELRTLVTAVSLSPASGTIDFERREQHLRFVRMYFPLPHPVGVASRPGERFGVLLSAGERPTRDPALLYRFQLERSFLTAAVDASATFEDVRAPVALAFAPEGGPLEGSLFVTAWGLRRGHLSRLLPDEAGALSEDSGSVTYDGTEAIALPGGLAFASDGHLYVTSRETGAIFRYRVSATGRISGPERLHRVPGTPGALEEGVDGRLYFLLDRRGGSELWRMGFDDGLRPVEPELVGSLDGEALALARDPIDGGLFALIRLPSRDSIVVELTRAWMDDPAEPPRMVFSLEAWRERVETSESEPSELPGSTGAVLQALQVLANERLDFVDFDAAGTLYLGAFDDGVVLEFQLPRSSGRYAVGLSAGVVDDTPGTEGELRMHGWPKSALSRP